MKLLVTGGAGFIGSNFIRYYLKENPNDSIVNLDKLTYAGNLENLKGLERDKRYKFTHGDITDFNFVDSLLKDVDAVINFAAESHVDRSIDDPSPFLNTNIIGTQLLLESSRRNKIHRFIQVSTDEVYGSLEPIGLFTERTALRPNSPYAASKASADLLTRAYFKTYNFPAIITRCSNNYGPYQFPEKLIPLFVTNALMDEPLPVYGDGLNIRDWLYVEDHCSAIDIVLKKGKEGEIYNIGGNTEKKNIEITDKILNILKKPLTLKKFVKDRPGHDRRYAIDSTKIKMELGWEPKYQFEDALRKTIQWYIDNKEWWERIKSGEYRKIVVSG
ncbi:MAG: dTDP-glucose 4,6-dehydratase [Nitrospinae bacterium]|nr:dTDP-glucose 4,6-dehydratase [Nitrospinota bacterium]MBI3815178.1 dTDP-glucose 4,6-dehydratase [Nitrospinota bacterium]